MMFFYLLIKQLNPKLTYPSLWTNLHAQFAKFHYSCFIHLKIHHGQKNVTRIFNITQFNYSVLNLKIKSASQDLNIAQ